MNRKRNEFLDISDEDEGSSEASDGEREGSRFSKAGRSSNKRRKLLAPDEEESEASDVSEQDTRAGRLPNESIPSNDSPSLQATSILNNESTTIASSIDAPPKPKIKALTPRQLAESQRKARKTGVVYLSRIPPYMKPNTVRQLLSPYGDLLRVFLSPETTDQHTKRVKAGGNRKRTFTEGWVEFVSKKKARICAEILNGRMIGGKKGGFYHDDIWNIKYLKKFKWDDLMQQVQEEAREREGKFRSVLQQETRERKAFLQRYESTKQERGIEAKRAAKKKVADGGVMAAEAGEKKKEDEDESGEQRARRETTFRQNKPKERDKVDVVGQPEEVKRTLGKIF